jgi:eukaryotic-like serine/threonine-protein kinase
MIPERWQQVREVLDRAIGISDSEQPAFLEAACSGDGELRAEVESLLHAHEQAGAEFLQEPIGILSASTPKAKARIGNRVGVYLILEQIGEGGMGEVYRAVRADGQYDKEVAVKLVRYGLDSAALLERFRHERQVLASLDHPNIARLFDGGTTEDGIPYLVMELIEGTPIDQYCDNHKLSITQRLRLFMQVCSAVQYAHQRLVIHRDIKPGNILVTKEGVPKLLDFGIAKILDPAVTANATLINPMTPEYASPEQIRGEPITTATDVYSLGVVLYQLLTGRSPYPSKTGAPHEFARAICDSEPERPSTVVMRPVSKTAVESANVVVEQLSAVREGTTAKLRRRLSGDLDTIVRRSMHKEPSRRYPSVEQFSEDIRRHLEGLPVSARRDSWTYRAGKFASRHKLGVASTALIALAVAGGVGSTIREARIAAANERRAEERFNDVRKLANSLMFEIHDAIRDLPGSTGARKLLVSRAVEYLDNLGKQAKGDVSLQKEIAAAYDRVGDVLGYPYAANLGDEKGALESYHKALAIRESLIAATPNDPILQRDMVGTYFRLAQVLESSGSFQEALTTLAKARPIAERLASNSNDPVLADHYGGVHYFTAVIQVRTGDPAAALENYRRGAAIREAALQKNPDNPILRTHLAADYGGVARCYGMKKDYAHAIELQSRATKILAEIAKANPGNTTVSEFWGEGLNLLADYRLEAGDATSALNTYQDAHKMFGSLLAADAKNSLAKSNFSFSNVGIARSLLALGNSTQAIKAYRESVAIFEAMSPKTSSNRYLRSGLASAYSGLGDAYSALATAGASAPAVRREYWTQAEAACQESLALWKDKEKRGELETEERDSLNHAARCAESAKAQSGRRTAK